MDDAKLPNGMTLDDIGQRLVAIDTKVTSLQTDMDAVKSNLSSLQTEVRSGFKRVDEELNAAKIRDEEAHRLLKFSLEAREGLRESMEARFDAVEKKQDEQIDLLKHAVRHLATSRTEGQRRRDL